MRLILSGLLAVSSLLLSSTAVLADSLTELPLPAATMVPTKSPAQGTNTCQASDTVIIHPPYLGPKPGSGKDAG